MIPHTATFFVVLLLVALTGGVTIRKTSFTVRFDGSMWASIYTQRKAAIEQALLADVATVAMNTTAMVADSWSGPLWATLTMNTTLADAALQPAIAGLPWTAVMAVYNANTGAAAAFVSVTTPVSPARVVLYVEVSGGRWVKYMSNTTFSTNFIAALKQDLQRELVVISSYVNVSSLDNSSDWITVQCLTAVTSTELNSVMRNTSWVNAMAVFAAVSRSSTTIVTLAVTLSSPIRYWNTLYVRVSGTWRSILSDRYDEIAAAFLSDFVDIFGTLNVTIPSINSGPLYVTVSVYATGYNSLSSASTFPAATAVNRKYTNSTATIYYLSFTTNAVAPAFQTFYLAVNGTRWLQFTASMANITAAAARDVGDILDLSSVSATYAAGSPFTLKINVYAALDWGLFPAGCVLPNVSSVFQALSMTSSNITIVSAALSTPTLQVVSFNVRLRVAALAWRTATAANLSAVMRALESDVRYELDAPGAVVSLWVPGRLWIVCNITTGIASVLAQQLLSSSMWPFTTLLLQQFSAGSNSVVVGTLRTSTSMSDYFYMTLHFQLTLSGNRWLSLFRTNPNAMFAAFFADFSQLELNATVCNMVAMGPMIVDCFTGLSDLWTLGGMTFLSSISYWTTLSPLYQAASGTTDTITTVPVTYLAISITISESTAILSGAYWHRVNVVELFAAAQEDLRTFFDDAYINVTHLVRGPVEIWADSFIAFGSSRNLSTVVWAQVSSVYQKYSGLNETISTVSTVKSYSRYNTTYYVALSGSNWSAIVAQRPQAIVDAFCRDTALTTSGLFSGSVLQTGPLILAMTLLSTNSSYSPDVATAVQFSTLSAVTSLYCSSSTDKCTPINVLKVSLPLTANAVRFITVEPQLNWQQFAAKMDALFEAIGLDITRSLNIIIVRVVAVNVTGIVTVMMPSSTPVYSLYSINWTNFKALYASISGDTTTTLVTSNAQALYWITVYITVTGDSWGAIDCDDPSLLAALRKDVFGPTRAAGSVAMVAYWPPTVNCTLSVDSPDASPSTVYSAVVWTETTKVYQLLTGRSTTINSTSYVTNFVDSGRWKTYYVTLTGAAYTGLSIANIGDLSSASLQDFRNTVTALSANATIASFSPVVMIFQALVQSSATAPSPSLFVWIATSARYRQLTGTTVTLAASSVQFTSPLNTWAGLIALSGTRWSAVLDANYTDAIVAVIADLYLLGLVSITDFVSVTPTVACSIVTAYSPAEVAAQISSNQWPQLNALYAAVSKSSEKVSTIGLNNSTQKITCSYLTLKLSGSKWRSFPLANKTALDAAVYDDVVECLGIAKRDITVNASILSIMQLVAPLQVCYSHGNVSSLNSWAFTRVRSLYSNTFGSADTVTVTTELSWDSITRPTVFQMSVRWSGSQWASLLTNYSAVSQAVVAEIVAITGSPRVTVNSLSVGSLIASVSAAVITTGTETAAAINAAVLTSNSTALASLYQSSTGTNESLSVLSSSVVATTTAPTSTTTTPSSPPVSSTTAPTSPSFSTYYGYTPTQSVLSTGVIAGAAGGGAALLIVIIIFALCCCRSRAENKVDDADALIDEVRVEVDDAVLEDILTAVASSDARAIEGKVAATLENAARTGNSVLTSLRSLDCASPLAAAAEGLRFLAAVGGPFIGPALAFIGEICRIAANVSAAQVAASRLAQRLLTIHPLYVALRRHYRSTNNSDVFATMEALLLKCKEFLQTYLAPTDESVTSWFQRMFQQITANQREFEVLHDDITHTVQSIQLEVQVQMIGELSDRPTREEMERAFVGEGARLAEEQRKMLNDVNRRLKIIERQMFKDDVQAMRIGNVQIEGQLRSGGSGMVHNATYEDNECVAKSLLVTTDEEASAIIREAQVLMSLRHCHNIVRCYGLYKDGMVWYLVMEKCEVDLRAILNTVGAIPVTTVALIGLQVGRALKALHETKLVHRDLKPENVMLKGDVSNTFCLIDFGSVKKAASESNLTTVVANRGTDGTTERYAAPEVVLGGEMFQATDKCDVYSFGMLLYELASGLLPFSAEMKVYSIEALHTEGRRPSLPFEWPEAFQTIITRCWDATPTRRPTVNDAVAELQAFLNESLPLPQMRTQQLREFVKLFHSMVLA